MRKTTPISRRAAITGRLFTFAALLAFTLTSSACSKGGGIAFGQRQPPSNNQTGALAVSTALLTDGTLGVPYSFTLVATGGTAPYTWALDATSSALPANLALNPDGQFIGTPAAIGTFSNLVVQVTDAASDTATRSLSLSIGLPATGGPTMTVSTAAGGLNAAGSGGLAVEAALYMPMGVGAWGTGNYYIADIMFHAVNMVDSSGVLTTVAGDPGNGGIVDGIPAADAGMGFNFFADADPVGNFYFCQGARVRTIDSNGLMATIYTLPGTASRGNGVCFDDAGNMYVTDQGDGAVYRVDSLGAATVVAGIPGTIGYGGDGGQATATALDSPGFPAYDNTSDTLYFIDGSEIVRKVDAAGIITTYAGDGTAGYGGDGGQATLAQLDGAYGLAVDSSGNLYIADSGNNRVRIVTPAGIIDTFAGAGTAGFSGDGGAANLAELDEPWDVAIDDADTLYIADKQNGRIRAVDTGGVITTVAGKGPWGGGGPNPSLPGGMCYDAAAGEMYFADTGTHRIRKLDTLGFTRSVAGVGGSSGSTGDSGPASDALLKSPNDVALDAFAGRLYIADTGNHRVRYINFADGNIYPMAGDGTQGFGGDGANGGLAQLNNPVSVAVDSSSRVYIADRNNHRIRMIDSSGNISTIAGTGTAGYSGDGGLATAAELNNPSGIVFDSADNLYIADRDNHVIRKIDAVTGNISTVAGNGTAGFAGDGAQAVQGELQFPVDVAVASSGELYIADRSNQRIRVVNTSGVMFTVGGLGTAGFSGDGGDALLAEFNFPIGVAVDTAGALYVSDSKNNRIRKLE